MIPTNSKEQRKDLLYKYKPEDFENYYDYFFYLHLNSKVQWMHVVGMVSGLILLPFVIYYMSWILLIVYIALFYGMGFISHLIYDGHVSRTAKEAPWYSFIYAMKINLMCMTGQMKKAEVDFLKKYPFAKDAYAQEA